MTKKKKKKNPPTTHVVPILHKEIELSLKGDIRAAIIDNFVVLSFISEDNSTTEQVAAVPLPRFADEGQAAEWARVTAKVFEEHWRGVMAFETGRHFINVGNFCLRLMGIIPESAITEIIQEQVTLQEKVLRARFRLRVGRGNFSKWTEPELREALLKIMSATPVPLKWDEINEELSRSEEYRNKAPASGGALRVLAHNFGLGLRELRREASRRRLAKKAASKT